MVTPLLLSISISAVLGPPLELTNTRLCPAGAVIEMAPPWLSNTTVELLGKVKVKSPPVNAPSLTVIADAPVAFQVEPAPKVMFGVLMVTAPPPVIV